MTVNPHHDDASDPRDQRREVDHVVLDDHVSTSARPAHAIIAIHLWTLLRAVGFAAGYVLAVGDGAATLIGLPHTDGTSSLSLSRTVRGDAALTVDRDAFSVAPGSTSARRRPTRNSEDPLIQDAPDVADAGRSSVGQPQAEPMFRSWATLRRERDGSRVLDPVALARS